jgi:hypothetical protein
VVRILALLPIALLLIPVGAPAKDHKFTGVKKCRSCHKKDDIGNQYKAWQESKHATAFETLASDQAREWAAERGIDDPQKADECLKCHSTAHGVPDKMVSIKFDRTAGVQCEACHGAGKDYAKRRIMFDPDRLDLALAKGLVPQTEEVCITCHNDESPAWDPERYTLSDGTKVGFDYDQAVEAIAHPVPEDYDPSAEEAD